MMSLFGRMVANSGQFSSGIASQILARALASL
jgi:hypothetical protein